MPSMSLIRVPLPGPIQHEGVMKSERIKENHNNSPISTKLKALGRPMASQVATHHMPSISPNNWVISGDVTKSPVEIYRRYNEMTQERNAIVHLLFQFFPSYVDNNHVLSGEEPDSIIKIGNPQSLSITHLRHVVVNGHWPSNLNYTSEIFHKRSCNLFVFFN